MTDLLEFLAAQADDSEVAWSLGTFGAIAEFTRDADEAVTVDRDDQTISMVTPRGALRIDANPALRPIASESLTKESWTHRVALCLPENACAMSGRTEFTEVGLDRAALREQDRAGVLFDLGLGALQADFYVRAGDPDVVAALRACAGKSVFSSGSEAMKVILAANPHRVFVSRLGRIEIYQPIPPAGGNSPSGPHTHVLPKLLAHGRTHSANEPLPDGWVPCAHLYPPNPIRDKFGRSRIFQLRHHATFQALLTRFGDPQLLALKRRVIESVATGHRPSAISGTEDRTSRTTVRVVLRQLQASGQSSAALDAWLSVHDGLKSDDAVDAAEPHP